MIEEMLIAFVFSVLVDNYSNQKLKKMKKFKKLNRELFKDAVIDNQQLSDAVGGCDLVARILVGGTYNEVTGEIWPDYDVVWDCEGWIDSIY